MEEEIDTGTEEREREEERERDIIFPHNVGLCKVGGLRSHDPLGFVNACVGITAWPRPPFIILSPRLLHATWGVSEATKPVQPPPLYTHRHTQGPNFIDGQRGWQHAESAAHDRKLI